MSFPLALGLPGSLPLFTLTRKCVVRLLTGHNTEDVRAVVRFFNFTMMLDGRTVGAWGSTSASRAPRQLSAEADEKVLVLTSALFCGCETVLPHDLRDDWTFVGL